VEEPVIERAEVVTGPIEQLLGEDDGDEEAYGS
jgi:hypothetical protein